MGMSANDKVGDEYSDLFCYWPALPGQLTTEQKVEEHQRQPDGWAGLGKAPHQTSVQIHADEWSRISALEWTLSDYCDFLSFKAETKVRAVVWEKERQVPLRVSHLTVQ